MSEPKEIPLNELPRWSVWPARLLGNEPFKAQVRTTEKVADEYGKDKWQAALDAFTASGGKLEAPELRRQYYARDGGAQRAAVHRGRIVAAYAPEISDWYDDLFTEWMQPAIAQARTVVELGAGFGQVLWALRQRFPGKQWRGGEYTDSAVELASGLYARHPDISVEHVNFYDKSYAVIEKAEGPVVVYTSQALEQIPDCRCVIDTLAKYRDKISAVFHLEPAFGLQDGDTVLGLMRRRYIEINDYNRNLVDVLKNHPDVRILRMEKDVIGWNAFNSLGMIHWEFKR